MERCNRENSVMVQSIRPVEDARRASPAPVHSQPAIKPRDLAFMEALHRKVQWLSAWTIHNANHLRPNPSGVKVGGHQASSASLATVMTALYFQVLTPQDRVAVKPHASPVFHAIQYLLSNQSREQLVDFRALGGAQAYPSCTKDADDVDFSTGSVGLGVGLTLFASLAQDYLLSKGWLKEERQGRMIALLGDAELDEGNIYEALIEGCKHNLRNTWWIIDYNRQSLDAVTPDRMFARFEDIFRASGWEVIPIKYGKQQEHAFAQPGGDILKTWIDECPNSLYAALTFKGGVAWRERLLADRGQIAEFHRLIEGYDDDALHALMINLGGHDLERLLEVFHSIQNDKPHCFIAYTIKGWGLPFEGHKDNHAGIMNEAQMEEFRQHMRVPVGEEWELFAGVDELRSELEAFLARVPFAKQSKRRHCAPKITLPALEDISRPQTEAMATQMAFGRIMNQLGRSKSELAERIITTSPDVTVSTNLGGWVNQRGIYNRMPQADVFSQQKIASMQKWEMSSHGQHLELGIAENNLFLTLAALGLTGPLFGERLIPVGTVYDPFICRGLDALNYACYQNARFLLVGSPSGVTLAPEGGAHQSIYTPLIGMGQDNLVYFEPAYVDELVEITHWAFQYIQADEGSSVYIRLSTRPIPQIQRERHNQWRKALLRGAYWQHAPAQGADITIVYTGAIAPEALAAHTMLIEQKPGAGLLAVPSPDRLHADWAHAMRARSVYGPTLQSHVERLLRQLAPNAKLVTVLDGAPETLSWLGSVRGHRVVPLGIDRFGQSGDVDSLYAAYGIDTNAILKACTSI